MVNVSELIQILPPDLGGSHPSLLGKRDDLVNDIRFSNAFCQEQFVGFAPSGPQRLADTVAAVKRLYH